jgi:hypothetical protein
MQSSAYEAGFYADIQREAMSAKELAIERNKSFI